MNTGSTSPIPPYHRGVTLSHPAISPKNEIGTMESTNSKLVGIATSMLVIMISRVVIIAMVMVMPMMITMVMSAHAQDMKSGEAMFRQCAACHTLEAGKNKIGPSLHGVFGRKAGTVDGFTYSDAMKNSEITWDEKTLAEYLRAPKKMVPGTKMTFAGIKNDTKLQDLIASIAWPRI